MNNSKLDQFLRWVAKARRRQTFTYHVGSLMYDRDRMTGGATWRDTDAIGTAAWDAYKAGHVALTQKREGPNQYRYVATAA